TRIAAIGASHLFVEENEIIHEHDLDTGEVARSYEADEQGALVVPTNISKDGAAILFDGDRHLLAIAPRADADESQNHDAEQSMTQVNSQKPYITPNDKPPACYHRSIAQSRNSRCGDRRDCNECRVSRAGVVATGLCCVNPDPAYIHR